MVQKSDDQSLKELLKTDSKIVIKFYANWCGLCRLFASKYQKISNKNSSENLLFLEINAEENPWSRNFVEISKLPFVATIYNQKVVETSSSSNLEYVERMVDRLKQASQ
jgi:thiol-disulfide isomerase/thioredoxin